MRYHKDFSFQEILDHWTLNCEVSRKLSKKQLVMDKYDSSYEIKLTQMCIRQVSSTACFISSRCIVDNLEDTTPADYATMSINVPARAPDFELPRSVLGRNNAQVDDSLIPSNPHWDGKTRFPFHDVPGLELSRHPTTGSARDDNASETMRKKSNWLFRLWSRLGFYARAKFGRRQ